MLQAPGATSYIGCIGKDKFGEEMKKKCTLDGVKVSLILWFGFSFLCDKLLCAWPLEYHFWNWLYSFKNQVNYYEIDTTPTGTCAVCVVGGERSDDQAFLDCFILLII